MDLFSQGMMHCHREESAPIPLLYLNHSMEVGGIETLIYDLLSRLKQKGFLPSVCVFSGGGSLEEKVKASGVQVYCLNKREGIDFRLPLRLRRILKKEGTKILHTHNFFAWLYGAVAARGIKGLRHIHTEHSNVDKKRRATAERVLSHITDMIVCVSEAVRQSMIENQSILPHRVAVIHNGVDVERFYPDHEKRIATRAKVGIKRNAPVVGIVARLAPIKNHGSLVKAFFRLSEDIPAAALIIVGDGELKDKLMRQANDMNLSKRVLFLGERHDIPELLNAMDVFVLPSLSEGHNITLLEAMATGLPVVATSVGGNAEVVLDGITGFLVPPNKHEMLSEKIEILLRDENLRSQMGKRSRVRIVEYFNMQKMINTYQGLYLRLVQSKSDAYKDFHG